jgi:hypothetical protein
LDAAVCSYAGDDEAVTGLGLVPTTSITITEGGDSRLPPDGSLLDEQAVRLFPALGAHVYNSPSAAIHRGEVEGNPSVWYTRAVDADEGDVSTFATLHTSSGRYGIVVTVSATSDDVAAAKRVAARVRENLADREA